MERLVRVANARGEDRDGALDLEAGPGAIGKTTLAEIEASTAEPLDGDLRAALERALGEQLGHVRIHADAAAARAASTLQARAFTIGGAVYFGSGRYDPRSTGGRRLIAHEVAHAVQQRGAAKSGRLEANVPGDAREVEAESFADRFAGGGRGRMAAIRQTVGRLVVQRDPEPTGGPARPIPVSEAPISTLAHTAREHLRSILRSHGADAANDELNRMHQRATGRSAQALEEAVRGMTPQERTQLNIGTPAAPRTEVMSPTVQRPAPASAPVSEPGSQPTSAAASQPATTPAPASQPASAPSSQPATDAGTTPTATPAPDAGAAPTATPAPTGTPAPTDTPAPTGPAPSGPAPSGTPAPSGPAPSGTPGPSGTPAPTRAASQSAPAAEPSPAPDERAMIDEELAFHENWSALRGGAASRLAHMFARDQIATDLGQGALGAGAQSGLGLTINALAARIPTRGVGNMVGAVFSGYALYQQFGSAEHRDQTWRTFTTGFTQHGASWPLAIADLVTSIKMIIDLVANVCNILSGLAYAFAALATLGALCSVLVPVLAPIIPFIPQILSFARICGGIATICMAVSNALSIVPPIFRAIHVVISNDDPVRLVGQERQYHSEIQGALANYGSAAIDRGLASTERGRRFTERVTRIKTPPPTPTTTPTPLLLRGRFNPIRQFGQGISDGATHVREGWADASSPAARTASQQTREQRASGRSTEDVAGRAQQTGERAASSERTAQERTQAAERQRTAAETAERAAQDTTAAATREQTAATREQQALQTEQQALAREQQALAQERATSASEQQALEARRAQAAQRADTLTRRQDTLAQRQQRLAEQLAASQPGSGNRAQRRAAASQARQTQRTVEQAENGVARAEAAAQRAQQALAEQTTTATDAEARATAAEQRATDAQTRVTAAEQRAQQTQASAQQASSDADAARTAAGRQRTDATIAQQRANQAEVDARQARADSDAAAAELRRSRAMEDYRDADHARQRREGQQGEVGNTGAGPVVAAGAAGVRAVSGERDPDDVHAGADAAAAGPGAEARPTFDDQHHVVLPEPPPPGSTQWFDQTDATLQRLDQSAQTASAASDAAHGVRTDAEARAAQLRAAAAQVGARDAARESTSAAERARVDEQNRTVRDRTTAGSAPTRDGMQRAADTLRPIVTPAHFVNRVVQGIPHNDYFDASATQHNTQQFVDNVDQLMSSADQQEANQSRATGAIGQRDQQLQVATGERTASRGDAQQLQSHLTTDAGAATSVISDAAASAETAAAQRAHAEEERAQLRAERAEKWAAMLDWARRHRAIRSEIAEQPAEEEHRPAGDFPAPAGDTAYA